MFHLSPFVVFCNVTGAKKVEINSKILSLDDGSYKCADCDYVSKFRHNLPKHIEAKHIIHSGYSCPVCLNVYTTKESLRKHVRHNKDSIL